MKIGKYTLLKKLATGGMAEIFLAQQEGPAGFQKIVVIKRILPHLAEDERFVTMFLNEARLAALLNHPNVVSIYDLGEDDGSYYLAMEYIHGRSLDQIVSRGEELGRHVPLEICARIIADACVGLDYAHKFKSGDGTALNLVHRDVSPQNILVTFNGLVKVVDFGVAKAATNLGKTQTGAVKGKYAYMSPEQIAGAPLDCRSDVFALGVVLFELATGRRPFGQQSDLLAVTAILNEPPHAAGSFVPDFPSTLEQVILKSLEKDKTRRYASTSEMHLDLERFIRAQGKFVTGRDIATFLEELFGDAARDDMAARAAEMRPLPAEEPTDIATASSSPPAHLPGAGAEEDEDRASFLASFQATSVLPDPALDLVLRGEVPLAAPGPDGPPSLPSAGAVDAGLELALGETGNEEVQADSIQGPAGAIDGEAIPQPAALQAAAGSTATDDEEEEGLKPTTRMAPLSGGCRPAASPGALPGPKVLPPAPAPATARASSSGGGGVLLLLLLLLLLAGLGTGGYLAYGWLFAPGPAPPTRPVRPDPTIAGHAVPAPRRPDKGGQGVAVEPRDGTSTGRTTPQPRVPADSGYHGPPGMGAVAINADPRATIFVDGKAVGRMPVPWQVLPVGVHKVRAVWPEGTFKPLEMDVLILPEQVITISLVR